MKVHSQNLYFGDTMPPQQRVLSPIQMPSPSSQDSFSTVAHSAPMLQTPRFPAQMLPPKYPIPNEKPSFSNPNAKDKDSQDKSKSLAKDATRESRRKIAKIMVGVCFSGSMGHYFLSKKPSIKLPKII